MTDNPFLAGIEREAVRGTTQRHIIKTLEQKFGDVPEGIRARVTSITDTEHLDTMFDKALRCESLQAFSEKSD